MPFLERPDLHLHYVQRGSGPPLLMLAGFMSDHASWTPLLPLLEERFTCIAPDQRTTGQTTPWDAPVSIAAMAQDARALMDHLGHDRFHVVGHSMGGIVALTLAQAAPARIASAHIAASAPVRLPRNTALFANLIAIRQSDAPPDTWLRALFPWLFGPEIYETPGRIDQAVADSLAYPYAQTAEAMAHQLTALRGFDGAALAQPACPTQALIAGADLVVPQAHILSVLGHLPHHIIETAGHSIHWDAPERVARHLCDFAALHPI